MLDSLKIYETLKTSSLPEDQAQAMTKAIQTAETEISLDVKTVMEQQFALFRQTFATKGDLSELKGDLKCDIAEFKSEMTAGLTEMESRLTGKMFAFWIGQSAVTVGLLFTALKLLR